MCDCLTALLDFIKILKKPIAIIRGNIRFMEKMYFEIKECFTIKLQLHYYGGELEEECKSNVKIKEIFMYYICNKKKIKVIF